jgi:hypothetical protein
MLLEEEIFVKISYPTMCFIFVVVTIFAISCSEESPTEPATSDLNKWVLTWNDEFGVNRLILLNGYT